MYYKNKMEMKVCGGPGGSIRKNRSKKRRYESVVKPILLLVYVNDMPKETVSFLSSQM